MLGNNVQLARRVSLNSVFITLGVAVILVLVTALVGPFFVDWTVYRSTFEQYAERALGHRVTVLGDADIQLLPSPSVTFSDVRVGEAEDPLLVVSRFQMRVELPPLLKGEIRVLDMELERPHLSLSLDENGRLDWLTSMSNTGALAELSSDDVAFERISVSDGALTIVDARSGETHQVDGGNLLVSARTLAGPYKIDGSLTFDDAPYSLRLATGSAQADGTLRVKGQVTPAAWPVNLSFDGALSQEDAAPGYEGTFELASIVGEEVTDPAWQVAGAFLADMKHIEIPSFNYRFGPEDRLLNLSGAADLVYSGDRRFEVRASAKQLDLDRLFGGGPQAPVALNDIGPRLISALGTVPVPDMDGVIALDIPAVVVGGGLAQDVRLDLETMLGGWRIARLAGRGPGRTTIATQGDLGLSPDITYRGSISLTSEQPGAFVSWWQQSGKGATTIQPVSLAGRINLVPDGVALDSLRVTLADAEAIGALSYRKPRSGNALFSMSLDADKLDIDQIEILTGLFNRPEADPKDLDVSLRILARELSIRGVDGKGLSLEAEYSNSGLRIDRLFAEDLAGAEIDVSGRVDDILTAPEGRLAGTLNATDLTGLVALLRGILPENSILDRIENAAVFLVPARFSANLEASAGQDKSELKFVLEGDAGGATTRFDAAINGRVDTWRQAEFDAGLALSGPDGGQILRQLGFDILPVDELGLGELSVSARGRPEEGLEVSLSAATGDASIGMEGRLRLPADSEPSYQLSVSATAADLAPFALLAGRVLPVMAGDISADIGFDLSGTGSEIDLNNLQGTIADVQLDGALAGDLAPVLGESSRRLKGKLHVSEFDLRFLTEAILGPDQWFSAGDGSSIWPSGAFGTPILDRTDLTLELTADQMIVDGESSVNGVRTELRLTPSMLRLDGLNGTFANGRISGALALRRSGAEGAVSGRVKLEDAALRDLIWLRAGRPVGSGNLDLFLEFEGAGRSISGMVAGLTGGGTFSVRDGELRGINPNAFPLVMRAVDAGLDLRDERIEEVFLSHMSAGSLAFERMEGAVTIIGGRTSARNFVVDSNRAEIFGSAEINLNTWTLDGDFSLKVEPGENAVTGAEPQVGLLFSGPVYDPVSAVDVAPFAAFLTLRAFEQEVERVENLQAEILERDRLLREIRRQKQDRERRVRELAEAEARAAQEEIRAAEDAADGNGQDGDTDQRASDFPDGAPEPAPPGTDQSGSLSPTVPDSETPRQSLAPVSSDFSERVRAVIDAGAETRTRPIILESGDAVISQDAEATGVLQTLEPPQSVEDLLAREIGLPPAALAETPDPSINGGVRSAPTTRSRQNRRRATQVRPAGPRYRTLPSGLVVEIPAE